MYFVYNFRTCVIHKILFLPSRLVCFLYSRSFVCKTTNSDIGWVFPIVCDSLLHVKRKKMPSSFNLKMFNYSIEPLHLTFFIFLTKCIFPNTFLLILHLLFLCIYLAVPQCSMWFLLTWNTLESKLKNLGTWSRSVVVLVSCQRSR